MYLRVISSCFGYSRALLFHRKFKITLLVSTKSPSLFAPALLYYILTVWLFKITSFIFNSNFRSYRNFKNFILGDNRRRRVSRFSSTHGSIRSPAAPKAVLHQQVRFLPPWPRSPPGTAQQVATALSRGPKPCALQRLRGAVRSRSAAALPTRLGRFGHRR